MKSRYHFLVWGLLFGALVAGMGVRMHSFSLAFFFACMLIPVMAATVYFYNQVLIPRYLVKGRNRTFLLYSLYTLVVSWWVQMLVLVVSFSLLANYQFQAPFPQVSDLFGFTSLLYLLVFLLAFFQFYSRYQVQTAEVANLQEELSRQTQAFIDLRVNRKLHRIALEDVLYLESMADYVQVHVLEGKVLITKEKISALANRLPSEFIRIHRSFLVHTRYITTYTREHVMLEKQQLPIGRTYKADTLKRLETR
ncbi:MAG: LytTR family DNA-binding domain-containing protein [Bacteroidota bacterium]